MSNHTVFSLGRRRAIAVFSIFFAIVSILASGASAQDPSVVGPLTNQIVGWRPQFEWTAVPNATWYRIYIDRLGTPYHSKWLQQTGTTWTADIDCTGGGYDWWVMAWSPANGLSGWSDTGQFIVLYKFPDDSVPLSPTNEPADPRPTFTWTSASNATYYCPWISRNGSKYYAKWLEGATNYTPASDLPYGTYKWWVRTWGPQGYGSWSDAAEFNYGTSTPLSPGGYATNSSADFAWTSVDGATWYRLWVTRNGAIYHREWVEGITNITLAAPLPAGDYAWWILPWMTDHAGGWSESKKLFIPSPGTYAWRAVSYKCMYGKTDEWAAWMLANKHRYRYAYEASSDLPGTVTIAFKWYNDNPRAYNPAWSNTAHHMSVFTDMASGAFPGYNFNFVYDGNTETSYANIYANIPNNLSYAWGKDVFLYYETIFNHEFGHTMQLFHHYDCLAGDANCSNTLPPGDTECIMDRSGYEYCSACRCALDVPLNVTNAPAISAAIGDILDRY